MKVKPYNLEFAKFKKCNLSFESIEKVKDFLDAISTEILTDEGVSLAYKGTEIKCGNKASVSYFCELAMQEGYFLLNGEREDI